MTNQEADAMAALADMQASDGLSRLTNTEFQIMFLRKCFILLARF